MLHCSKDKVFVPEGWGGLPCLGARAAAAGMRAKRASGMLAAGPLRAIAQIENDPAPKFEPLVAGARALSGRTTTRGSRRSPTPRSCLRRGCFSRGRACPSGARSRARVAPGVPRSAPAAPSSILGRAARAARRGRMSTAASRRARGFAASPWPSRPLVQFAPFVAGDRVGASAVGSGEPRARRDRIPRPARPRGAVVALGPDHDPRLAAVATRRARAFAAPVAPARTVRARSRAAIRVASRRIGYPADLRLN
jgi:hypothetical protein